MYFYFIVFKNVRFGFFPECLFFGLLIILDENSLFFFGVNSFYIYILSL